jgi:hypothetical protein
MVTGIINGDIGCKLSGTGAMRLEIDGVDFVDCTTACLQIIGNITGTVITRGCKFSRSQAYGFVNQVGSSNDWFSYHDEFLDAGLGGNAAYRNLAVSTSGKVVLVSPKIGRTTGGAAAQYWMEFGGAGTVDIYNPIWVGTPPSGLYTGSQIPTIHVTWPSGVQLVTASTATVLPSTRVVIVNFAGTCTLTLPTISTPDNFLRPLKVITKTNNAVNSAASNVVPVAGTTAAAALVTGTAGKFIEVYNDGQNYQGVNGN